MKVTNYELSRKLAEIGFGKDLKPDFGYDSEGILWSSYGWSWIVPAYDLETILSALRATKWFRCTIGKKEANFGYCEIYRDKKNELQENSFSISNLNGESLVDTGAKFLILLHEKGLVKFGEVGK